MISNPFKKTSGTELPSFAGRWFTTYGVMDLAQEGERIHGVYHFGDQQSKIDGKIEQGRFVFTYEEPNARGEGWFALLRPGKFEGRWRPQGIEPWSSWTGERGFEGVWESTFGLVRLIHERDGVVGFYEGLGSSTIQGQVKDSRLALRYQEPNAAGEAHFALSDDGMSFTGEWKPDGGAAWQPWNGRRLRQMAGVWLVVIEAYWQRHLMEREYSFGNMLREFFARVPGMQFSQRFFTNEAGLRQWCRDLMYVPGPVVAVIAAHATPAGIGVAGQTIQPQALTESLRYADNVQLLHFSSCLTMQEGPLLQEVRGKLPFPISGYTTSVDWAASAIAEFTYLDMILARGMAPADAAAQLSKLLSFAGDRTFDGSVYPAAGFRMVMPG